MGQEGVQPDGIKGVQEGKRTDGEGNTENALSGRR